MTETFTLDHLLVACTDVNATSRRLRHDHSLDSTDGGVHHEWETHNKIVPIGTQYIELFGVRDPDTAAGRPIGRWLTRITADGDRLAGCCLTSSDFAATCRRLNLHPETGTRDMPNRPAVRWRQAGTVHAMAHNTPFFFDGCSPTDASAATTPAAQATKAKSKQ